jgi:hypothetical protein
MSETPQERIEKWLAEGHWVKEADEPERGIREAIRAVLAELEEYHSEGMVPANAWAYDLGRLKQAEAERDALRIASDEDARALLHLNDLLVAAEAEVERLRAALEEVRRLTKSASDVFLIRISSVAAQALYPDWRSGGVKP